MPMHTHMRHERMTYGDIKLYAGTACPDLAQKIADYLGVPLCGRDVIQFPNDNLFSNCTAACADRTAM